MHWTTRLGLTLAISVCGGLLAQMLGLPAGMLVGSAVAVSIASVLGVKTYVPDQLRNAAFVIVGMTLGTSVAHNSLELLGQWPASILALAVVLVVIVVSCTFLLSLVFGYDKATAYLASFPGHLSFVLGMAEAGYGNLGLIAIIQSTRILLLTIIVPIAARLTHADAPGLIAARAIMDLPVLLVLGIACIAGGFAFRPVKIPAAFVLGPMAVATTGKLMGLYEGAMPLPLTLFGFVVMGALIGSRFTNTSYKQLAQAVLAGTVITLVSFTAVTIAVFVLTHFVDMPPGQIWLGLAPGALEAMGAMGIALGYDTAFIAAHHTARFFLLTLSIPSVGLFFGREKRTSKD